MNIRQKKYFDEKPIKPEDSLYTSSIEKYVIGDGVVRTYETLYGRYGGIRLIIAKDTPTSLKLGHDEGIFEYYKIKNIKIDMN